MRDGEIVGDGLAVNLNMCLPQSTFAGSRQTTEDPQFLVRTLHTWLPPWPRSHNTRCFLLDGTELPCEVLGNAEKCPLIWGHGLGPTDPRGMDHRSCESFTLIDEAMKEYHRQDGAKTWPFSGCSWRPSKNYNCCNPL